MSYTFDELRLDLPDDHHGRHEMNLVIRSDGISFEFARFYRIAADTDEEEGMEAGE